MPIETAILFGVMDVALWTLLGCNGLILLCKLSLTFVKKTVISGSLSASLLNTLLIQSTRQ